jgi:hypothetical protein
MLTVIDALINYGKAFLRKRKYKVIAPPVMMLRDQMAKTAQLEQFDEELVSLLVLGCFFWPDKANTRFSNLVQSYRVREARGGLREVPHCH